MKKYRISAWLGSVISIILIFRGLITATSSDDIDVATLVIADILPIILLYISVCLFKAKDRRASASSASVLIIVASILWILSLIPGLPIIIATLIISINVLISAAALLTINWYVGRGAGLTITIIVLFIGVIFVSAYGASKFSSTAQTPNVMTP